MHGGIENWNAQENVEWVIEDEWIGIGKFLKPWKSNPQKFRQRLYPASDISRVKFLDGKIEGDEWGIQHWKTYTVQNGELKFETDKNIKFILPTVSYFFELPFRIHEAEYLAYAGEQKIDGEIYQMVLASWQSLEPNKDMDQYLLYINKKSHRLEKAEFTVRDMAKFVIGAVDYKDYKMENGFLIPSSLMIYRSSLEKKKELHKMSLERVLFNQNIQPTELYT